MRPRRILPAIVLSQVCGTSLWFAGNAILPDLRAAWGLEAGALAISTSAVQLGFIGGTLLFAFLGLPDRVSPRLLFLLSACLGAGFNAALLVGGGLTSLLALRFLTGICLAGIYPVGMKIAAGWYREGLGDALGWLVGALVFGTALPFLVRGVGQALSWTTVTVCVSALAAGGGILLYLLVPDGPYMKKGAFTFRAFAKIFSVRGFRSASLGYFGHMWELYAFYTFLPVVLGAPVKTFGVIAAGAVGCVVGGILSRRTGSRPVAFAMMSVSGACCLASPLVLGGSEWILFGFFLIWGFSVVGDSPQFSALAARDAPPELVGSGLTLMNCIGFSITIASIQLLSAVGPANWIYLLLAPGPLLGLIFLGFRDRRE